MRRLLIVLSMAALVLAGVYGPSRSARVLASGHAGAPAAKKKCHTVTKTVKGKKVKKKVCKTVRKATPTPVPTNTPTDTPTATATATATNTTVTVSTPPAVYTGTLQGAAYKIEMPANWNGALALYSHGFTAPGSPNPATDATDALSGRWLTDHGYAIAGSSYSQTGWAVADAFHDQMALLDYFTTKFGAPKRVIAWGVSMGGLITAGLIQKYPDRFAGAVPMCGVLGGTVGLGNGGLDAGFAFATLNAGDHPPVLTHIYIPQGNASLAVQELDDAQSTAQGRARNAMTAALYDVPGWFSEASPEPSSSDYAMQEQNQYLWLKNVLFPLDFAERAELEQRAGGNGSWNIGVDYAAELQKSKDYDEVKALYAAAGLDLNADLQKLQNAPRVTPEQGPVKYLSDNIIFNGKISMPVLTMHTTGDGFVPVENEQAYADVVNAAGNGALLRQTYIHRAGHCTFTPAEVITAFQNEVQRIDSGQWSDTGADALNAQATSLGATMNVRSSGSVAPAFIQYTPGPYWRPFDSRSPLPS